MATVISATKAKQHFAALLDAAQRGPVRIQRHERDIAVLVSPEDFEMIRRTKAQELIRLTEEIGRYAAPEGMTEAESEPLLAEREVNSNAEAPTAATLNSALARGRQMRAEEEKLRAAASPQELLALRQQQWREFNRLMDRASEQAIANGLTEQTLSEILAEQ